MNHWWWPMVRLDAWLLLGAAVQCALILRARRFKPVDWIIPMGGLVGGTLFWFACVVLYSNVAAAAECFIVGFSMAVICTGMFVADSAPPRLTPAAVLSLTITFWAVYLMDGMSRPWLFAAVPASLAAVWYAWYPQWTPAAARMLLQGWSLTVAAVLAAGGLPARVLSVVDDFSREDLAPSLHLAEIFVCGAQFFLFMLMATGLVTLSDTVTWRAWSPSERDERLRWSAVGAILVQSATLVWGRRQGTDIQTQIVAVSVLAATAHGAMSGPEAIVDVHPALTPDLELDIDDQVRLEKVGRSALAFVARRRVYLYAAAAAITALAIWRR
ncbi:MAG: hypothetical protein KGJ84_05280 [Elusimicrobia bacterium]|nr:hypothetical protein [Elusimicrobiota bacterium]